MNKIMCQWHSAKKHAVAATTVGEVQHVPIGGTGPFEHISQWIMNADPKAGPDNHSSTQKPKKSPIKIPKNAGHNHLSRNKSGSQARHHFPYVRCILLHPKMGGTRLLKKHFLSSIHFCEAFLDSVHTTGWQIFFLSGWLLAQITLLRWEMRVVFWQDRCLDKRGKKNSTKMMNL